ncbi:MULTISPECIES: hypothetical protein [Actinosynnema]|uniref:hypothetical protein n=1 Tax=Actinosynnema TaxID=40566 RepID=UPI0020A31635|nr:hypothetical protein [Actinosynnema pretiosum]
MSEQTNKPTEMPSYHAILLVDVKDFSGMKGRDHPEVAAAIPDILAKTFERCALKYVWISKRYGEGTGDGYAATFPPEFLPYLLNPFLGSLQAELDDRAEVRTLPHDLRMRVTVHVGPIPHVPGDEFRSGTGPTRVETQRLVDCEPVKSILVRSGPATRVAAVVSRRVYQDAVLSGYSAEDPSLYVPVQVKQKTYEDLAYLRVPLSSGRALQEGLLPPTDDPDGSPGTAATPERGGRYSHNEFTGGTAGTVLQVGFNEGGVNTGQQHTYNTGRDSYHHSGSGPQFNRGDVKRYEDRRGEQREP